MVLLALLAAGPLPATEPAEIYTGRELLADCKRNAAPGERTACQGWIDWAMSSTHYYCLPPRIDDAAVRATLIGWFEAHAPKLHMPGGWLVQNAMIDTYPCKRQ